MTAAEVTQDTWARLREPFGSGQIGKLAKAKVDQSEARCGMCGSKHKYPNVAAVHVDYVGHAVVTGRLNDVVGPGNWSYTIDQVVERDGHITGVVGTMTIDGRTIGQEVGTPAKGDLWGEEFKTAVSDYIRRAAMRFGVALDLWSKQELESTADQAPAPEESGSLRGEAPRPGPPTPTREPGDQAAPASAPTPTNGDLIWLAESAPDKKINAYFGPGTNATVKRRLWEKLPEESQAKALALLNARGTAEVTPIRAGDMAQQALDDQEPA